MEQGYLYAIGAAVAWGLMYAIEGKILTRLSTMSFFFVQALFITIIISPFFLFGHGLQDFQKNRELWFAIALTVALGVIANFSILKSIQLLGATTASSFEIGYPFFVALFSTLLFGARFGLPTLIGGLLIFLGSVIIIRYG